MGISAEEFYNILIDNGIDFFTGVPDSLLADFCACVEDNISSQNHIIAANEGNAIAIAAGYNLGTGKLPLVYMQNSGLGNATNPLLSLCDKQVYSIPMMIVVGWRGEPGIKDEPQHIKAGRIQLDFLQTMEIPFEIISKDEEDIKGKVRKGIEVALRENHPFVLLIRKGTFAPYERVKKNISPLSMSREGALEIILSRFGKESLFVSTTGKTSREVFEIRERNKESHSSDFLTVGSMGHCSSIALGNALANPKKDVICIDGDGALIMHMGSLAIIGTEGPANFKHIVMNNGAHESVGGQPTVGLQIDFCSIAKACGYNAVFTAETEKELPSMVDSLKEAQGPALLEIKVKQGSRPDLGRPTTTPIENKQIFMSSQKKSSDQEVYFGYGTIQKLNDILKKLSPEKIFLVTGRKSYALSGAESLLKDIISPYKHVRFYDFEINPKLEDITKGIELFKEEKCDCVIGIGGGTVMDIAKAISLLSAQQGELGRFLEGGAPMARRQVPSVVIPTTAGTGSESTHFSVVYKGKTKHSLSHESLLPDYVILDPQFTETLPSYITACTGMDALCQGVEAFWSVNSTEESRMYSRQAIELIMANIVECVNNPGKKTRENMLRASHLAGRAINIAKTSVAHSVSYPLTSYFNIAHGHAVALTLPYFIECNSDIRLDNLQDRRGIEFVAKIMQELVEILGALNPAQAREKVIHVMKDIHLATSLSELGVNKDSNDVIINNAFNPEKIRNNPKLVSEKDIRLILKELFKEDKSYYDVVKK